jgi:predicted ATP-grasp superfamily ATP-dependent carboligase
MDALPDLIEQLAKLCPLFGNRAEAVRACVNPRVFFPLLDRLEIPYPEICWHAPKETAESFLVKQGGEGGTGVSVYRGEEVPGAYYQRRVAGKAYTLAFLAGSGQLWWYGFNTLYQTEYNDRPFLFAGIINRADLPPKVKKTVVEYAQRLSSALSLTGLQGLDFMVEGEVPKVLELNPRPGAALGLWDGAWPSGLMAAQVKLSQGEAVGGWRKLAVKGSKVVFAEEAVQIPCDFSWPRWCADLALPGTKIPAGGPICTVGASGATVAEVEAKLYARINWIIQALERKNDAETSFSQP